MHTHSVIWTFTLVAIFAFALAAHAEELPPEAAQRFKQFRDAAAAIQRHSEDEIKAQVDAAAKDLQEMQDSYTKAGKLDEAVAIRNTIRQLKSARPTGARPAFPSNDAQTGAAEKIDRPFVTAERPLERFDPTAPQAVKVAALPELELPTGTAPEKTVLKEQKDVEGLKISYTTLASSKAVGDIVWSPKGDAFFMLTADGVLSRIVLKDFIEARRIDLARRCSFLSVCGEGLLATMNDLQEVWVIDPGSLAVKKRIPSPGVSQALSGPGLKFALAASEGRGTFGRASAVVYLDLNEGKPIHQFAIPTLHARITPDGKYYFAQGGIEQLTSFRIDGNKLVEHQTTERIAQNGQRICLSPDSKYVCLPSGGGHYGAGYSTFVYPVDNLAKAEFTIDSGAYPRLVGFDPAAKLVYAQNHDTQLIVFTNTAIRKADYKLTTLERLSSEPSQFVPHPDGKKLLVEMAGSLMFVEIP